MALYSTTLVNAPHATVPQWWHMILVAYSALGPFYSSQFQLLLVPCLASLSKTLMVLTHFATESIRKTAASSTITTHFCHPVGVYVKTLIDTYTTHITTI